MTARMTTVDRHEHFVTIDHQDGQTYRYECEAAPDALCRARWVCDCEQIFDAGVRHGMPAHRPDPGDLDTWHAGRFDPDCCSIIDWAEQGDFDESFYGSVRVPFVPEWQGDYYEFRLAALGAMPAPAPAVSAEQVEAAAEKDRADRCVDYEAEPGIARNAFERGFFAALRAAGLTVEGGE